MPEIFTKILQRVTEFWKNLDKSQQIRLSITAGVILTAIVLSVVLLNRDTYIPLIRNADSKDIGSMAEILDDEKIPYTLKDSGNSIYISAKDNNKAQVLLFQNGYPKSGMTFEDAFSMIKINTTESDKKKLWENYKRSTLITKLKMFDNVEDADVDLAMPEPSVFVTTDQEQQKTTAYVRVTPKGELTAKQVQGIVMVVSRSVENLDPKDVTVVDNNLNVLNSDTGDSIMNQTSTQDEMRLKKKKELEKNVYDLFNGQFENFDSIRVIANPVLDFDKIKSLTNAISKPDGMESALISKHQMDESVKNGTTAAEPGTGTNPGTTPSYPTGSTDSGNYTKKDLTENYDYTRSTTEAEKALGSLAADKSSMTVLLWYGKRVTDETKLSPEFIDLLRADVSKATGIPVAAISINKYKLAAAVVVKETVSEMIKRTINDYGFFMLVLLLIVGLLIAALPRRKKAEVEEEFIPVEVAAAGGPSGPRFIVPEGPTDRVPEIELEERSEVKKQLDKFVNEKPDAVAQLLRNWLSDEWD